jgi:hypothetical protein
MDNLVTKMFACTFLIVTCHPLLLDYSFLSKNLSVFGTGWSKKVKEASTDDRDVVDSELQNQIADATHDYESYNAIMSTIWSRLEQPPKQWKIIYKVCF